MAAHSIEMVGEKVEIFRDGLLVILMSLMVREVRKNPSQYPSFLPVAEQWADVEEAGGPGPGCIDLGFERIAANASLRCEVWSLLSVIRSNLERAGPILSNAELNALTIRPNQPFLATCPISVVLGGIDALERLLK